MRYILVEAGVNGPRPVTSAIPMPNPIMYTDWAALSALVFAVVLELIAYIDLYGLYR